MRKLLLVTRGSISLAIEFDYEGPHFLEIAAPASGAPKFAGRPRRASSPALCCAGSHTGS